MKPEYRILLVDDEPEVLEALTLALRRAKEFRCVVDATENGPAAIDRLESAAYDLVIADYRMPGMTGVEVLARAKERFPGAVRVLLTGYSDVEIAMEAMERANVHYYVQKPWDNDDLRLTVFEALRSAGSSSEKGKTSGPDASG